MMNRGFTHEVLAFDVPGVEPGSHRAPSPRFVQALQGNPGPDSLSHLIFLAVQFLQLKMFLLRVILFFGGPFEVVDDTAEVG